MKPGIEGLSLEQIVVMCLWCIALFWLPLAALAFLVIAA